MGDTAGPAGSGRGFIGPTVTGPKSKWEPGHPPFPVYEPRCRSLSPCLRTQESLLPPVPSVGPYPLGHRSRHYGRSPVAGPYPLSVDTGVVTTSSPRYRSLSLVDTGVVTTSGPRCRSLPPWDTGVVTTSGPNGHKSRHYVRSRVSVPGSLGTGIVTTPDPWCRSLPPWGTGIVTTPGPRHRPDERGSLVVGPYTPSFLGPPGSFRDSLCSLVGFSSGPT